MKNKELPFLKSVEKNVEFKIRKDGVVDWNNEETIKEFDDWINRLKIVRGSCKNFLCKKVLKRLIDSMAMIRNFLFKGKINKTEFKILHGTLVDVLQMSSNSKTLQDGLKKKLEDPNKLKFVLGDLSKIPLIGSSLSKLIKKSNAYNEALKNNDFNPVVELIFADIDDNNQDNNIKQYGGLYHLLGFVYRCIDAFSKTKQMESLANFTSKVLNGRI